MRAVTTRAPEGGANEEGANYAERKPWALLLREGIGGMMASKEKCEPIPRPTRLRTLHRPTAQTPDVRLGRIAHG